MKDPNRNVEEQPEYSGCLEDRGIETETGLRSADQQVFFGQGRGLLDSVAG